ncbi:MAG: hypothetical protein GF320_12040 [Armatimonadia bacterium]|nr:hypothetical protein [Armatimonadia bacterium]
MGTDWQLIRRVLNDTITACEAIEQLAPDVCAGEYEARSEYQDDVNVADFLGRLWQYPEGSQRDIIRIRWALGRDQKHIPEIGRALINTAVACAETIGLEGDALGREWPDLEPHCGSAGRSVESQLLGIPAIQNGWMLNGIRRALEEARSDG